ncbi:unnamed protein product [Callosobruchus maculatus]|uniref:peptide-methionine (S)-S-oxide reductase n=1 Tax=Callosobruchus maculatus TaxID=64391 RepID=A0A653BHV6_CALMS|nr:unnamed protein product [Callosobruchus maculatus]
MPSVLHEVTTPFRKATFGMGCFWAGDALFGAQPGVLRTRVGYSGGTTMDPVYKKIQLEKEKSQTSGQSTPSNLQSNDKSGTSTEKAVDFRGDHTEVVEIDYDPKVISYEDLLELFWNNHEYGLTNITKRQYMSLILYHNEDQKRIAEISMKKEAHKRNEKLSTEIAPAGPFYPAEDYHQKYRLQEHSWLCEELGLTPALLQSSHVAARLNGYIVGVGKQEDFEKDVVTLGLSEKMAKYVRSHLLENEGGNLYC